MNILNSWKILLCIFFLNLSFIPYAHATNFKSEQRPNLSSSLIQEELEQETTKKIKKLSPLPFDARYRVTLNGLPTGLAAHSHLRKVGNHYLFSLQAKSWIMDYQEKSAFTWPSHERCGNAPEHYRFSFKGFNLTEEFEIDFNHLNSTATSITPEQKINYEIAPGITDALSYLLVIQCDIQNGVNEPNYKVGYKRRVQSYQFKLVGEQMMKTPFGKVNTLKIERIYSSNKYKTTYWVAPDYGFALVQMKHKEGKIVTAKLKLKELNFEDLQSLNTEEELDKLELKESYEVDSLEDEEIHPQPTVEQ